MSDAPAAPVEAVEAPVEAVEAPVEAVEAPVAETVAETKTEETAAETTTETTAETTAETAAETKTEAAAPAPAAAKPADGKKSFKFDPSVLPVSDDHSAIQAQVNFYFGDSNLPTDKFLWELTGGAENKPVELKKICQFGRMRRFPNYETVVAALKESKFLVVAGEPGAEVVSRKHAYNPDRPRTKIDAATVYVKGFGAEEPSTQVDLEAFFKQYGTVNAVRLRRMADKSFKGSVFVEFADAEDASKFIKLEPAPKWKDQDLKIMSKPDYVAEKAQLIREGKIEPNNNSAPRFYEGRSIGGGRGNFRRGGSNANGDWKKRRDDDRKNGFRGGRGGRGNGRGGRGNRGGDHKNRNAERAEQTDKPTIQATNDKGEAVDNKRPREDDAAGPPAKKVDAKAE